MALGVAESGSSTIKPRFWKPSTDVASYLDKDDVSAPACFTEVSHFTYNRNLHQSIQVQREKLPIYKNRTEILYLLEKYQIVVLVGETGSGKSTQIPQYMIEAGWPGQIGICEPRKVAALSLAGRVAEETGTLVQGEMVGYSVRFDICKTTPKIKYMTEGILIREMMSDPLLKMYSAIMLDEVHERTMYTDILMGLMKKILKKRSELRLIIASATMDADEMFKFFNSPTIDNGKQRDTAAIMSIKGRQYPVQIYYTTEPVPCYVQKSVEVVTKIHNSAQKGDILIFLTGQEEVERVVRMLRDYANQLESDNRTDNLLTVLPMYGSLPHHDQLKVFRMAPEGHRKVVVATNVAETCITIPGIAYVIDCGFVKIRWFNEQTQTDSLMVMPISQASAEQRAGRAGRMRAGTAYRLYTEECARTLLPRTTPPELVRSKLTFVVLQLKALGIHNVVRFKFVTQPPLANLRSALEVLYALAAIDINGELTRPLGFHMAEFALDPLYSKILLQSAAFGCSEEVLTIVSMLQVETVFVRPVSGMGSIKARVQKRFFEVEEGDLMTYLNVYNAFVRSDDQRAFCQRHFVNYKSMKRVCEVRIALERTLKGYGVHMISCTGVAETVCKCLVIGLFPNVAYLHHSGVYKTVRGDIELFVHPDSVLYTITQPQWVMFCDVVHTTKLFMRDLTVIKSEWLLELVPHYYHKTGDLEQ